MKVLHIEDEADTVATVGAALQGEMTVMVAGSLADGQRCLVTDRYDVVLVDLNLPDSQGVETVRALAGCGVPLVVLSGLEDQATLTGAAEAGADDYLLKSALTRQRLLNRLRFAHSRHMARPMVQPAKRRRLDQAALDALTPYIRCGQGSRSPFALG